MRDPLFRKLFQSRDAREKLRGMGGIVASSPSLAETVAKFENGGMMRKMQEGSSVGSLPASSSTPTITTYYGVDFALFPDGRIVNLATNTEIQDPILREAVQAMASGDPLQMMTPFGVRPETGQELPAGVEAPGLYDVLAGDYAGAARADEYLGEGLISELEYDQLTRGSRSQQADVLDDIARQRLVGEQAPQAVPQAPAETSAEGTFGNTPVGSLPAAEPQDEAAAAAERLREAELLAAAEVEGGDDLPPISFDTSLEDAQARIARAMGESGGDENARDKAMANLAMIGLAIASGQSPDALSNIAQGALVGMQGIQAAEAAEAARQQEARLLALQMAASEVELSRRLESQERIAAMGAGGGSSFSPTEPFVDAVRALAETGLSQGLYEDLPSALAAAETALLPYYSVTQDGVTYEYQADGSWRPVVGE
jgi:hypothetical protein